MIINLGEFIPNSTEWIAPAHITGFSANLTPEGNLSLTLERLYKCSNGECQRFANRVMFGVHELPLYPLGFDLDSMARGLEDEEIAKIAEKEGIKL